MHNILPFLSKTVLYLLGMPMRVIAGFSSCASPQDILEELVAEAARYF